MKKALLRFLCCALTTAGLWGVSSERTSAQPVSLYTFASTAGTYTPITTGTSLTSSATAGIDDENYATVTLPFTFTYANNPYTTVGVSSNGYIRMGAATTTDYTPLDGNIFTIAGFGEDLYSVSSTTVPTRDIRYATSGAAGSQVFTIQWTSWGFWSGGLNDINFQIKLFEGTNIIQFVYGGMPLASATSQTPQIGLTGAAITDFKALTTTTSWATPTAATVNSATMTFSSTVKPDSGRTYTFTPPPACTGAPTAGTVTPAAPTGCPGSVGTLTVSGFTQAGFIFLQWQSSTNNTTFTDIPGATSTTYTTPAVASTTYYRVKVRCGTTDSSYTPSVTYTITPPATTTATLPYTQSFENWISTCSTTDRPGTEWTTNPFNGQEAWRRNDQGASANWTTPTGGIYSPTFTSGAYSARFHSYYTSGVGSMLLNINLSPAGTKLISFDYTNTSGTDSLYVELSTDGGATYTTLGNGLGLSTAWSRRTFATTSTAAAAILRFRGKGDFGFSTDIGMDSLTVAVTSCVPTTTPTVSGVSSSGATITYAPLAGTPSGGYQYYVSTSNTPPTTTFTGTSGTTTANISGLAANTLYYVWVRSDCGTSQSQWSNFATFTTLCNTFNAPFSESFNTASTPSCWTNTGPEPWYFNQSGLTGSPNPDYGADNITDHTGNGGYFAWVDGSGTGTNTGITLTSPVINITTVVNPRLRFYVFSNNTTPPGNNLLRIEALNGSTWILLDSVKQNLGANWVEKTIALTGITSSTTQIRFVVNELNGNPAGFSAFYNDILIDDVNVEATPTCFPPTNVTLTGTNANGTTINWGPPSVGTPISYQWEVRTSGLPGSGSTGLAQSGTVTLPAPLSATVTNLTPNTAYTVYVRSRCSPTDSSLWTSAVGFTTPCASYPLPFAENFNTFLPACWSRANGPLTVAGAITPTATNSWSADGYLNNGTTGAAKINLFTTGNKAWMISPTINLGATTSSYVLEFDMAVTVWNATTTSTVLYDSLGTDDTLAVVVSYDNGVTWSSTNALRVFTNADDTLPAQRYYLPFTGNGLIKIGFFASDGSYANCSSCAFPADNDVFIDSVRVSQCIAPTVALGNDTTLCGGGSITLNSGPGTSRIWSTGDTSQSIIVSTAGVYSVTVFNGGPGCSRRDTIVVNASPLPTVSLGPDAAVCGNVQSYQLNAGNPGSNYSWSTTLGSLPATTQIVDIAPLINNRNLTSASLTPPAYPVIASVTNAAGCVGRDTVNISIVYTARVDSFEMAGTDPTFTFTPVHDSFATSYAWTFGDGGTASTATANHTYVTNGTFTVRLVVSNSCASDTAIRMRMVTSDVKDLTLDGSLIQLYPNPTAADATLAVDGGAKLRGYQVLNAAGAVVATRTLDGGATRTTLNTSAFAPGIYTLRIQLDKGVVVRKLEVLK